MPDQKDILRQTNQALDKMLDEKRRIKNEEDRKYLVSSIGKDLVDILDPSIKEMAESLRLSREELKAVLSQVKVETPIVQAPQVYVTVPEIKVPEAKVTVEIPEIKVPEIKLPVFKVPKPEVTVNIPEIKIPNIEIPESIVSIPDNLSVSLKDVDRNNPLHVILTDSKGLPYSAQPIITGSSGGGGGVMTGFDGSGNKKVLVDTDGKLQVGLASSFATSTNVSQLGGNTIATDSGVSNSGTLRVVQAVDSVTSVNIVSGSASGTQYNDGATPDQAGGIGTIAMVFDGSSTQSWSGSSYGIGHVQLVDFDGSTHTTLGVSQISGSIWSTTVTNDANSLIVNQVSGSSWSTSASIDAQSVTLDVRQVSGSIDSVIVNSFLTSLDVKQVSGSADSMNVIQLGGNTIATGNGDVDSGTLRTVKVASVNSTTTAISVGADASTNIVPTNLGRRSIIITHASGSNLYVATGTAASTTSLPVVANQIVGFDDYTGPINAIAEEQAGTISVRYIEIA